MRPGAEAALHDRLGQLVEFALAESLAAAAGGDSVLLRIGELMFVEVLRRYVVSSPAGQRGWLAGLRDSFVSRALGLLHQQPARAWTLEALARETGLSRSALAERFTHCVGQPPMQYLTRWRLQLAARLLADGEAKVARRRLRGGLRVRAAFSRAFKKAVGLSPAAWRRRRATL